MVALDRGARGGESRAILRELVSGLRAVERAGVTVGVGLAVGAFGAAANRPRQLVEMPAFAGDLLDPARSHGDVLVQVAGDRAADVRAAVEGLLPAVPGWRERWRIEGFRAENREEGGRGLARNPFHFTEGFGNPAGDGETADRALVRAGQGEPEWAVGGSYQVVRIIRFATELWDKDSVSEQERIIGRRRDGRWLDGAPVGEEPNFAADPKGGSPRSTRMYGSPRPTAVIRRRSYGAVTAMTGEMETRGLSSRAFSAIWRRGSRLCRSGWRVRPWPSIC